MIHQDETYVFLNFACAEYIRGLREKPQAPFLVEVAAVKIGNGKLLSHFSSLIAIDGYDAHDVVFDGPNVGSFGVTEDHLIGAPSFKEVAKRVCAYAQGCTPVALPRFSDTSGMFLERAKQYGLAFDRPVRDFQEVFPIRRKFKEDTPLPKIFSAYDIFLLDEELVPNARRDLLTWTLAYARLALALMDEEEGEIEDLYETLFSEHGVTFLEGRGGGREDELALEFCRLAHEPPWDGVKVFTDKEGSIYSAFPTEKICLTEQYEGKTLDGKPCEEERLSPAAAEKIAPHLKNCRLAVLDLALFSEGENFARYRRLAEALRLSELAEKADVNFLIPAHFEKPFSAWRNSKTLGGRYVQTVQLFEDRGEYGMEIFGGKKFRKEEFDRFIDTLAENEAAMSALCATDVAHMRREYRLCAVAEIKADSAPDLVRKLHEFESPSDAYIVFLRIPHTALETLFHTVDLGRPALLAAIESNGYEAVIGCYKKR